MQAGNDCWEEPDLAGLVYGHRGRDHRSHIRSPQATQKFQSSPPGCTPWLIVVLKARSPLAD